jgi:gliding motility-associated-like protein
MKKHLLLALFFCFGISSMVCAQVTTLNWQTTVGGTRNEYFADIKKTTDGGSVAVGFSNSIDGDLSANHNTNDDGIIVKFSSTGVKQWVKNYGAAAGFGEHFRSVVQSADGGYLVVGFAYGNDGDLSGNHDNTGTKSDMWVVKLDASGVLQWQKCFGGAANDVGWSVIKASDGNYVIAGVTYSTDGDVSGNHGNGDGWLVKISSTGTLLWQKSLGGSAYDVFSSLSETTDGGYIVTGTTSSNNGDVSGFHGVYANASDVWVVKTNSSGTLAWQKCYGGSNSRSSGTTIIATADGGFFLAGTIGNLQSGISGDIAAVKGLYDIWVFKGTAAGAITWQNTLGGTSDDLTLNAIETLDGGFMINGSTASVNGDITAPRGENDIWLVKLSTSGVKEWQTSMGGSKSDEAGAVQQVGSNSYLIAGTIVSTNGQVSNPHGGLDAWVAQVTNASSVLPNDATLASFVPSKGVLASVSGTADYNYTVTVAYDVTSTILRLTTAGTNATINIGGIITPHYVEQKALASANTPTVVNFTVKAEDGVTTKTYKVTIIRQPDVTLSALTLSNTMLSPAFLKTQTNYTAQAGSSFASTSITPTATNTKSVIKVNGTVVKTGTASLAIPLVTGENLINVVVTSANGLATQTYVVRVFKAATPSTNANLSFVQSSGGPFTSVVGPADYNYTTSLLSTVTTTDLEIKSASDYANITVNGVTERSHWDKEVTLSGISTVFDILIIAEDGVTTKTCRVTFVHTPDVYLKALTLSDNLSLNTTFTKSNLNYSVTTSAFLTSLKITPTVRDPTAIVKVNGVLVTSGSPSPAIQLVAGQTLIGIEVSATVGGTASKTYTLTVTRPATPSNNAKLLYLQSAGGLPVVSGPADYNYTRTLSAGKTSIDLEAKTEHAYASITVNGVNKGNHWDEDAVLIGPSTVFDIVVTAEDGIAKKTYRVTVNRTPSPTDAFLDNIVLSVGEVSQFSRSTDEYGVHVPAGTASLTLTPTTANGAATVTVNGMPVASGSASPAIPLVTGTNDIIVVVTATNGTTKRSYKVQVYRPALSANADLFEIGLVTLSPYKRLYKIETPPLNNTFYVSEDLTSVTLDATASFDYATVTLDGVSQPSMVSKAIPLTGVTSPIMVDILVTAEDGVTTKTYTVTIIRKPDLTLSALALSSGTLSPVFAKATTEYSASVSASTTTLTLTPTLSSPNSTVKVNGITVATGTASAGIPIHAGSNVINTVVKGSNGTSTKTYTVTVTRPVSTNAVLSQILTSPAYSISTTTGTADYNRLIKVPKSVTSITVAATPQHSGAKIKINGGTVAAGVQSAPIHLGGYGNVIHIVVTAENGTTQKTYDLYVVRPGDNAVLSNLQTTPDYPIETTAGPADYNRAIVVPWHVTLIHFSAAPYDAKATMKIDGTTLAANTLSAPVPLNSLTTVVNIVVTAEDKVTKKTYAITVTRRPSDNAVLSQIVTGPDYRRTVTIGPADYNRSLQVPWNVASMTFASTPQNEHAIIKVNGTTVPANTPSAPVALSGLTTVVYIEVTAEDGVTVKNYAITVNRNPSDNAVLASITNSAGVKLNPTTGPADYNRTASVAAAVSSITFAAVPQNEHASIKVNGNTVASGVSSAPIALSTGPNTVNIVVTAEDGVTVKTYAVTVTRAASFMMASKNTGDGFPAIRVKDDRQDTPTEQAGLLVRQGLSPNGDGINDRLAITGINAYPDNTVKVMNRNGDVIYQAKAYDNNNVAFDGRNNKGVLQQPGTYFYSVEYKQGSEVKRKTGYLVIKY